jgi:hypothetical protein
LPIGDNYSPAFAQGTKVSAQHRTRDAVSRDDVKGDATRRIAQGGGFSPRFDAAK